MDKKLFPGLGTALMYGISACAGMTGEVDLTVSRYNITDALK
jgi:hypothetical protein